jgi:hypothetical protein
MPKRTGSKWVWQVRGVPRTEDFPTFTYSRCLVNMTPSFTEGVARIFDFGDVLTNRSCLFESDADDVAIASDWGIVGNDLRKALDQIRALSKERLPERLAGQRRS